MQNTSTIREISGQPGQVIGQVVMPAGGTITFKINGDILQTFSKTSSGLEQKETYTRIQNIESIEIVEGRLWWLLAIGFPALFFFFIGLIFIIAFFLIKRYWVTISAGNTSLVLFFNPKEERIVKQFCQTLLAIARQTNSQTNARSVPQRAAGLQ